MASLILLFAILGLHLISIVRGNFVQSCPHWCIIRNNGAVSVIGATCTGPGPNGFVMSALDLNKVMSWDGKYLQMNGG
jgi:hypothetical protein